MGSLMAAKEDFKNNDWVLTRGEIDVIALVERALGCLSLFSVALVFLAFGLSKPLRTSPNCFIVCSCVANVFGAAGAIIGRAGIHMSSSGQSDALCQAQAFILQTFTQSDPWWSFAMTFNVLVVITKGQDPNYFKKRWWLNCLICFGGPSASAIVLLVTGAYGNAGNWCWVRPKDNDLRIFSFFIPVWFCISGSLLIYTGIGIHVFRSRNRLRRLSFSESIHHSISTRPSTSGQDSTGGDRRSFLSLSDWPLSPFPGGLFGNLHSAPESPDAILPLTSVETAASMACISQPSPHKLLPVIQETRNPSLSSFEQSSGGRMKGFGMNPRPAPIPPTPRPSRDQHRGALQKAMRYFIIQDQVKSSYLQTSSLFAFIVLVTWVPVSTFRMLQVFRGETSFASHLVIVVLLSLQGFWNCVLFFYTNRSTIGKCVRNKMNPATSGIAGLLAEPGMDVTTQHAAATTKNERDRQVRRTQMSIKIPWRRSRETERTYSWDFLDIGLESRGNVISISRGSRGTSMLPSP